MYCIALILDVPNHIYVELCLCVCMLGDVMGDSSANINSIISINCITAMCSDICVLYYINVCFL